MTGLREVKRTKKRGGGQKDIVIGRSGGSELAAVPSLALERGEGGRRGRGGRNQHAAKKKGRKRTTLICGKRLPPIGDYVSGRKEKGGGKKRGGEGRKRRGRKRKGKKRRIGELHHHHPVLLERKHVECLYPIICQFPRGGGGKGGCKKNNRRTGCGPARLGGRKTLY